MNASPDRQRLIETLSRRHRMNEIRYYMQNEIAAVDSCDKIVLNSPIGDDLNFRHFEAMSCGALLLTRRQRGNGVEDFFEEGVHYEAFDDEAERFAKVDRYLANDAERRRVAEKCHAEVMAKHTLALRLQVLREAALKQGMTGAPLRKLAPNEVLRTYAVLYERRGSVEALLRLTSQHRADPTQCARLFATAMKSFARRTVVAWREGKAQHYGLQPS
jgi:hypothetical protein